MTTYNDRFLIGTAALAIGLASQPLRAQEAPTASTQAPQTEEEEAEEIVVQATRSGRRVQDEPIRVEVIDREEIEEKILMAPRP